MSDELVSTMEKPQAILNNVLAEMNKKALASFGAKLKLFLATGTEPFFRKGMGERYFSKDSLAGGVIGWIIVTSIALLVPDARSAVALLCKGLDFYGLAQLLQYWALTAIIGGALVFFFLKYGKESLDQMAKHRADGTAYHTQSRGTPRWEGQQTLVPVGIFIVLLLFDLPAGILFLASCCMSAKLAGEQQAAIYARYLDALDKKIEQDYLEDAILGKCPTEITQLVKPLPVNLNTDLRDNMAAAAVGKPVKIVAKAPRAGKI